MTNTHIGAGNVTITLNGEEVTLRPTLRAAQAISRSNGGIMEAVNRVGRFDMEAITAVVAHGLGISKPAEVSELGEKVYATGLVDLIEPVTRFLTILANGGRPVSQTSGIEEENPPKGG
jgi:hypothetical protein